MSDTRDRKERILDLLADGHGCRDIARALDLAPSTVSETVKNAGYSFDSEQTRAATEARVIAAREKAADMADRIIDDISGLRARMWSPHTEHIATEVGVEEVTRPLPPPQDVRNYANSIASLTQSIDRLRSLGTNTQQTNTRSVMSAMLAQLTDDVAAAEAAEAGDTP